MHLAWPAPAGRSAAPPVRATETTPSLGCSIMVFCGPPPPPACGGKPAFGVPCGIPPGICPGMPPGIWPGICPGIRHRRASVRDPPGICPASAGICS